MNHESYINGWFLKADHDLLAAQKELATEEPLTDIACFHCQQCDVDIAVIMNHVESKIEQAAELWNELKDIPISKDIIVASQEEFNFYKNECGSIFKTIAEKGIVLYGY